MLFGIFLTLLVIASFGHAKGENVNTTIDTLQGPIKGAKVVNQQTGKELLEFRGIRYAKALRFKKPESVEKWNSTYDATEFGAGCPQLIFAVPPPKTSEDCLFLNIYVPIDLIGSQKFSVMVWMHGGGLHYGFSNDYDGGWIATEGNVIVVTINYRLNIFGFLALDHPASKGNYGLWDQKMAFQWVQQNIGAFGGDPHSVTIFGQSGGSWSTSFQSLIPSNKGLFHRAISQSGVVGFTNVQSKKMIYDTIVDLANKTACSPIDMFRFVDCLRNKTMEELVMVTNFFSSMPNDRIVFQTFYQPFVDGDLLPEHPLRRLQDKNSEEYKFFNSLDFLAGTNSNEGVNIGTYIMPQIQEHYSLNMSEGIKSIFVRKGMIDPFVENYYNNDPDVKTKLYDFYHSDDLAEQGLKASYLLSDVWFCLNTNEMLDFHLTGTGKTFQYVFSKQSEHPINGQPPTWCKGVGHGEELKYMFDIRKIIPSMKEFNLSNADKIFAKRLIQYWSSFAKTGQPTAGVDTVAWKQYDTSEKAYLNIDVNDTVKTSWKKEMYELWSKFPVADARLSVGGGANSLNLGKKYQGWILLLPLSMIAFNVW